MQMYRGLTSVKNPVISGLLYLKYLFSQPSAIKKGEQSGHGEVLSNSDTELQ